ncbi:hypothetical protein CDL12_14847 [Handroanthus impetiginosus]|uniref:Retrotransposon gag protein n=1 Tax=Handroanthus impetiginosus TaxID=429701 RepID=A0A2G9H4V0_9LAMI|nr:hypothetical protein CDL12_14847 [Handroanthus impetiginosus]
MKASTKKSMVVNAATVKFPTIEKKNNDKVENQRTSSDTQTLKEMQKKEYPFPDSNVPHIFDELLARKLIKLPQPKRPEEVGKTNDPKYCKYHRVVSHPIEKCFVFKDKIMALANEGKSVLDTEDVANASLTVKKGLVMPITNIYSPSLSKPSSEIVYEEFKGVFDPKSYKLLEKSDFDFASPPSLGKLQPELTGEKIHGLTKKQQELRKQGFYVEQPKVGLGYEPTKPVIIHITKKDKCVNVQHITAEDDTKDKGKQSDERVSIFNRLGSQTSRPSVFERLGTPNQMPMFKNKLATHRRSVFA